MSLERGMHPCLMTGSFIEMIDYSQYLLHVSLIPLLPSSRLYVA